MATITALKELVETYTPLLLFECTLPSGEVQHWATHRVDVAGVTHEAVVLGHNLFELRSGTDGIDAASRLSLILANSDSRFSQRERSTGWKGSRIVARFLFADFLGGSQVTAPITLFRGVCDPPEEITESAIHLNFTNRLNIQRLLLPETRIQKRCPWQFPSTEAERNEALTGASRGRYSGLFRCGYSAGLPEGAGNLHDGEPFTSCDYTRASCEERGMFSVDQGGNATARFGGLEFLPPNILVRGSGDRSFSLTVAADNEAKYNDFVPAVYGTVWYHPVVSFARNDGNLLRMEVLLAQGEIEEVVKVVVNGVEIPSGRAGQDMTATGWYNVFAFGGRTGGFNLDFADSAGQPQGDPYGSMAALSLVVPNRLAQGGSLPKVEVLVKGSKLPHFGSGGEELGTAYTDNPAWILLDVLRRCGWSPVELDLASFARATAHCAENRIAPDLHGNPVVAPRFACNFAIRKRRSAAEVVRGVRANARLLLRYGSDGRLEVTAEDTIAGEQPERPEGSNSQEPLQGGWPCYEFGDGSGGFSGIVRRRDGSPSIRLWSRSGADTPNRLSLEFQDVFNEFQQDSLSLVDFEDWQRTGQETSAALFALGVPTFDQAARLLRFNLDKLVRGNVYVEFETSMRAVLIKPGDLITLTYLKEGLVRQLFRVLRVAPGLNFQTARITAQIHDDAWYDDSSGALAYDPRAGRQPHAGLGLPRPLLGKVWDEFGKIQFEIREKGAGGEGDLFNVLLEIGFSVPARPGRGVAGVPLIGLAPHVTENGGSLAGGTVYYYAVAAVDAQGEEGGLSFVARASLPFGLDGYSVTLTSLSFPRGAASFHVYRGESPTLMLRIAAFQAPAATYTDTGFASEIASPPDENFDHANFYWRYELASECPVTGYGPTSVGTNLINLVPNEFRGAMIRITGGRGEGQERVIAAHGADSFDLASPWAVEPDFSSRFVIGESGWRFGARAISSPVEFEIPNRQGATVHILGRSANVLDQESAFELSTVTRWQIGGGSGAPDQDVPLPPSFALNAMGAGVVEVGGIAFESLENTNSVASGTLRLNYWNELRGASAVTLAEPVGAGADTLTVSPPAWVEAGTLLQIGREVLSVQASLDGGARYEVIRGAHGSPALPHAAGAEIYHLDSKVFVMHFARQFFGSPSSGSFSYPIVLPNARIASAELYMTNSRGHSETSRICLTGLVPEGLRTFAGGQFTLQVEGFLAIQTDAAPAVVVEAPHAARDVSAMVGEAPSGGPVEIRIRADGAEWCRLTIDDGATASNVVDGFRLPPLAEGSALSADILTVPQSAGSRPGRDLTVTIRL